MDDITLDYYELQSDDTQEASDHLPLVFDISISTDVGTQIDNRSIIDFPKLYSNYPNPFNSNTLIKLYLPYIVDMELYIIDIQGRIIKKLDQQKKSNGIHTINWDGKNDSGLNMSSGVYFILLRADNTSFKKKIILMK